jgi:hypothetical protein
VCFWLKLAQQNNTCSLGVCNPLSLSTISTSMPNNTGDNFVEEGIAPIRFIIFVGLYSSQQYSPQPAEQTVFVLQNF